MHNWFGPGYVDVDALPLFPDSKKEVPRLGNTHFLDFQLVSTKSGLSGDDWGSQDRLLCAGIALLCI